MKKTLSAPDQWLPSRSTRPAEEPFAFSQTRKNHIKRLEALRESKVLVYIERQQAPQDVLRYVFEHLRSAHRQTHRRLDLVLFGTRPGQLQDLELALQWMALCREHAREVSVIIPSQGTGLATLLAIGADSVLMHPLATLGQLSAAEAMMPSRHFQSWLETLGSVESAVTQDAWHQFIAQCGPQNLAQAHRTHAQLKSGLLALIQGRVRPQDTDNQPLWELLDDPTAPLARPMDRRLARHRLALPTQALDADTETALWDLFCAYEHPLNLLQNPTPKVKRPTASVVIESMEACHVHRGQWQALNNTPLM